VYPAPREKFYVRTGLALVYFERQRKVTVARQRINWVRIVRPRQLSRSLDVEGWDAAWKS